MGESEVQPPLARILVVDDDPQFRRALRLALDSHGYDVEVSADGRGALDAVAARAPDLIVLDWHLPELDGIQTCRALREHSAVPIVMASGNRANSKEMALAAGATDYLPKPFSIGELLLCIEAALGKPNS